MFFLPFNSLSLILSEFSITRLFKVFKGVRTEGLPLDPLKEESIILFH